VGGRRAALAPTRPLVGCGVSVALVCACTSGSTSPSSSRPTDVVAQVSESISTVVNVRWRTEAPCISYVEYGPTQDMELNTPLEAEKARRHSVDLLGLTADTVYYYRVVAWDGDTAGASEIATIATGELPESLPALTQQGDGHDQFTLVPILGETSAVTIIDPQGQIVWYHVDDRELDLYRARFSADGTSVLYNAASASEPPAEDSELVRVSLDGSETSSVPVPLLGHDFVEHPDGTLAAIVVEYRDFEGQSLRGDQIVEIDADGNSATVWSAWDCFDPAQVAPSALEQGWTFANALDYDSGADAYYLGLRNFSSITKIDRASGTCEWVLGEVASTIDFADGSTPFSHQEQFHVHGDYVLVLDRGGEPGSELRVLEYELDLEQNVAAEVWSFSTEDPGDATRLLGEPTRLTSRNVFVNWSALGRMQVVNLDGESTWELSVEPPFSFGWHALADTLYFIP
jgi:hypothetical protein